MFINSWLKARSVSRVARVPDSSSDILSISVLSFRTMRTPFTESFFIMGIALISRVRLPTLVIRLETEKWDVSALFWRASLDSRLEQSVSGNSADSCFSSRLSGTHPLQSRSAAA